LRPALDAAVAGTSHVFFMDAAHFAYGTFLCCLWSDPAGVRSRRLRSPAVQLARCLDAVTRRLLSVTNMTVVNTDTMCQLLRVIAAENLVGPVTVVQDNARYQRNKAVQALAAELSIPLLYLPRSGTRRT